MRRLLCVLLLLGAGPLLGSAHGGEEYDLVVRGGRVADGTGNPAFHADVAVRGGRIARVGRVGGKGRQEIAAAGRIVAPGFIDVHTHAEGIRSHPAAENFVRMGVTSIVTGNCGGSRADLGRFFQELESSRVSINVASLIGHNTVRREEMGGNVNRAPTEEELERMRRRVARAMDEGAVGLSTGLIYNPGVYSRTEEIVALARPAAAAGGIYASHMRNESSGILDALEELFRISREAGLRAQVSHLKLGGRAAWGRTGEVLAAIERARRSGLDITQDQYVYTASSTGISTLIPAEHREGSTEEFAARLADPARRAAIAADMKASLARRGHDSYDYVTIAGCPQDRALNGKSLPEAARLRRGSAALEEQIQLVLELQKGGGASCVFHGMSEDDLQAFLRHPNTMVASDSGTRVPDDSVPHPRGYGNNARVLGRYVRELGVLRLEDAIRKMTSLPAAAFRLEERGRIETGYRADLVVFDPEQVGDPATYSQPHQYAVGFSAVLVNGTPVLLGGKHTGAKPGRPLRMRRVRVVEPPGRLLGY